MSCPTCDHTMRCFKCAITHRDFFWCERCGTAVACDKEPMVPALVSRCREFEKTFPPENPPSVSYSREWARLGITESINTPKDRPRTDPLREVP